jgi:predicted phosphodiesterase
MNKTPAVWIISDIHVDLWAAQGWRHELPEVQDFWDPDRANVYLILGDSLNGIHRANEKSQEWLLTVCERLSRYGHVYFVIGNHECYRGVFEDSAWRFENLLGHCARVIHMAETFLHGDTAFILATNWPRMSAGDYLMHQTDLPAFMTEREDLALPMTASDMELLGEVSAESMINAAGRLKAVDHIAKNLVVGTHFATVENPSQRAIYPSINPYFDPPINHEFLNECFNFHAKTGGELIWCYGHSHINDETESTYGGRIVTNQIGYLREATKRGLTNPFQMKRVL